MEYKALIENKKSVREYKKIPLKEEQVKEIKSYIGSCKRLVSDIEIDIRFMDNNAVYQQLDGFAGYKGHMINAPHYIIILSENKDNYIENSGYIGEEVCLKAKELEIGSCWITFEKSKTVIEKLSIITDKEVTGIIALGYDLNVNSKTVMNAVKTGENYSKADMKVVSTGASNRLGLEEVVYMNEWGNHATVSELEERALLEAFSCATLAPSALNRQPWRFIVSNGTVILAVRQDDQSNTYEQKIDAGIVMLYFEAIISETLFKLNWILGNIDKDYKIPNDYSVVGYCNI